MKSKEHKSICYKVLSSVAMFLELKQCSHVSINKWLQESDTLEIPIRNSTFLSFPLVKSCKLLGMESLFSLEDWLSLRLRIPTHFLLQPCWIRPLKPLSQMLVTLLFLCAQLSALTWDVFPYPILEPTRDGSACAMVQFTTSSEESDKVLPRTISLTSTTQSMDPSFALKSRSSPTSPPLSSTFETNLLVWLTAIAFSRLFYLNHSHTNCFSLLFKLYIMSIWLEERR